MSLITPQLFSIQNVHDQSYGAATVSSILSTPNIYCDSLQWSTREIEALIVEFQASEQVYSRELPSLLSLLNNFDLRFNNYFDDSKDDTTDEMMEIRKKLNGKLIKITRTLLDSHHELSDVLKCEDSDVAVVKFSEWCVHIVHYYTEYIQMYRLNTNQPKTELHLRRRPLVRVRYLKKFVTKLIELIQYQMQLPQTSELLSNLQIANHKLTQSLALARQIDERERSKLQETVHTNNVKSLTELTAIGSGFNQDAIFKSYKSEVYYTNETLDTSINFNKMELLFLTNGKSSTLNFVAIVSNEDYGKSLVFPPLRRAELRFVKQVESTVIQFCSCLNDKVNLYIKIERKDYAIRDELISFFPPVVSSRDVPMAKRIENFDRLGSLGLNVTVPALAESEMFEVPLRPGMPPRVKSMDGIPKFSDLPPRKLLQQIYSQEHATKSVPDLSEAPSFNLLANRSTSEHPESRLKTSERIRDFRLTKENLRNSNNGTSEEGKVSIAADLQSTEKRVVRSATDDSISSKASDEQKKKKTKRHSIFNVFSTLLNTTATSLQKSTTEKKSLESAEIAAIKLTPELATILVSSNVTPLQTSKYSRWLNTANKWSNSLDIEVKLITNGDFVYYLVGYTTNTPTDLVFITKLNSNTKVERILSSSRLRLCSVDHQDEPVILSLIVKDAYRLERLNTIIQMKINCITSHESNQPSTNHPESVLTSITSRKSSKEDGCSYTSENSASIDGLMQSSSRFSSVETNLSSRGTRKADLNLVRPTESALSRESLLLGNKTRLIYQTVLNINKMNSADAGDGGLSRGDCVLKIGDFGNKNYYRFVMKGSDFVFDLLLRKSSFQVCDPKKIAVNCVDVGHKVRNNFYFLEFSSNRELDVFMSFVGQLE
ncbi:hypothetical protein CANARDRAFT_8738 [[Candida] arabinofermentans NRRL YB-2248]|uniref:PH-like domain-containing protein n=1 Tax=[Candida] arabinofermentans NRRL YB-2248 TaxID=983967 RepID=A0A1E4SY05_9ASCO|nr:hypothetical protein CANARDRAFT_8738 [[Candida] arabinofermentans NRRL YB-2248]